MKFELPPLQRTIPDARNPAVTAAEKFNLVLDQAFEEATAGIMGDLLAQDYRETGIAWIRVDANGSVERVAPTEWSWK